MLKKLLLFMPLMFLFSCEQLPEKPGGSTDTDPDEPIIETNDYELSYWIDMDVIGNHTRGYWFNLDESGVETETPEIYVANAARNLAERYGANKLYVIYHRQYEMESAKKVFGYWVKYGKDYGMDIVPCVCLQSYKQNNEKLNFSDAEIISFAKWALENVSDEFSIYDVYTRDQDGSLQDEQLKKLYNEIGNKIIKVGMQPLTPLKKYYKYAVQDCWTAECQGRTNELWENPVYYNGSYNYGRRLLESWVVDRIDNDSRKWVYCLIPVAWDYDVALDKPSYDCPGDNALTNDPPIKGRIELCRKYIAGCYENGVQNPLFGGYSCDLHILHANSAGCGKDNPNFYTALRTDKEYTGYFSEAVNEIGSVYKNLKQ